MKAYKVRAWSLTISKGKLAWDIPTTFVTSKAGLGNLKRCMVFHEGTWSLKGVHGLSKGYYDNIMLYKSLYWCRSCNGVIQSML